METKKRQLPEVKKAEVVGQKKVDIQFLDV